MIFETDDKKFFVLLDSEALQVGLLNNFFNKPDLRSKACLRYLFLLSKKSEIGTCLVEVQARCFEHEIKLIIVTEVAQIARTIEQLVSESKHSNIGYFHDSKAIEFVSLVPGISRSTAHHLLVKFGSLRKLLLADRQRLLDLDFMTRPMVDNWFYFIESPFVQRNNLES